MTPYRFAHRPTQSPRFPRLAPLTPTLLVTALLVTALLVTALLAAALLAAQPVTAQPATAQPSPAPPAAGAQTAEPDSAAPAVDPFAGITVELPTGGVEVPLVAIEPIPALEVMIGDAGPFLFELDTGAGGAGRISAELAERFGLQQVGEVLAGDPSGRNTERRPLFELPELSIGGAVFSNLPMLRAAGRRPDAADGVLGFALFRELLLTLDYPASRLRLERGALPAADGREIVADLGEHGVPTVGIEVAGRPIEADIDSGSMGWMLIPESFAERLPLVGEPRVVGRARTNFNEFEIKAAPLDGTLEIGRHKVERPMLEMAGLFPRANLGSRLLRSFALTFDQQNRRIRFARGEEGPITQAPRYQVGLMLVAGDSGSAPMEVTAVVPGGAAADAGLQAGDRIVEVGGKPLAELPAGDLMRRFSRPEEIELTVERDGERRQLRLTPRKAH